MQTLDFSKTPVIPPHCLWVSWLLLESGCRASAGLPRLFRVRHTAGNRLAMGDKVPGAWGAPGTDPIHGLVDGLAALWAGGGCKLAETVQLNGGRVTVNSPALLLVGAALQDGVRHGGDGERATLPEVAQAQAVGNATVGDNGEFPLKSKVLFIPKPDPWIGTPAGDGKNLTAGRPISFCRKNVTFSSVPKRVC